MSRLQRLLIIQRLPIIQRLLIIVTVACAPFAGGAAMAQALDAAEAETPPSGPLNIPTPTLGGTQYWTDLVLLHDWRIQQHAYTGHCRLLDDGNIRRAWGSFEHCRAVLDETKVAQELPPLKSKVVILLHGLCSVRFAMNGMVGYLREHSDYSVLNMSYASSKRTLVDQADALHSVLSHLDGVEEVNLVGHSMGNIVIRRYFARRTDPERGLTPDRRIRRIVMLGPPNKGSDMASRFDSNVLVRMVAGGAIRDLGDGWEVAERDLAIPPCEFGVVAGDTTGAGVDNPLIPGPDDLLVGVSETRLPRASDFLVVGVSHLFLERDAGVQEATLRFLQHGYFRTAEARTPIPAADDARTTRR
ncbi:MAG: alpha/beta hydrolase [Pirellulaceae bacterium]